MPEANKKRSMMTTGMRLIHTARGKFKNQIHNAPPTACAVNVAPRLRANRDWSCRTYIKIGMVQNSEKYHTERPTGLRLNKIIATIGITKFKLVLRAKYKAEATSGNNTITLPGSVT